MTSVRPPAAMLTTWWRGWRWKRRRFAGDFRAEVVAGDQAGQVVLTAVDAGDRSTGAELSSTGRLVLTQHALSDQRLHVCIDPSHGFDSSVIRPHAGRIDRCKFTPSRRANGPARLAANGLRALQRRTGSRRLRPCASRLAQGWLVRKIGNRRAPGIGGGMVAFMRRSAPAYAVGSEQFSAPMKTPRRAWAFDSVFGPGLFPAFA